MNKTTKKTLVTKLAMDATLMNDAQVDAIKAMYTASYAAPIEVSFEVLVEDGETRAEDTLDLYQRIQQEFMPQGDAPKAKPTTIEQALAELSRIVAEFGKLFGDEGKQ